jgi:hypothetical protein
MGFKQYLKLRVVAFRSCPSWRSELVWPDQIFHTCFLVVIALPPIWFISQVPDNLALVHELLSLVLGA